MKYMAPEIDNHFSHLDDFVAELTEAAY